MMRSRTRSDTPPQPKHAARELEPARVTPYRQRVSRTSTREAARVLLREYHEHGDLEARERLIQQYMPLVKSLARRYSAGGELYEDLVQVGCIGLIKAVDRFDSRRAEFGAFVIPNVAGEIKRYLRDRAWPVRVPRRLQELRPGLRACSAELSAQLARPATISEIADSSGIDEQEVAAALDTERIQSPLSLSEAASQDDESYCELDVLEGGYEQGEQRALLAAGFRVLDERERRLLHLRYFAGLSQPQIAKEVGISPIHVSRLTRRALLKLRAEIGPAAPEALAS
jgi:RNA polymerase sigma-B factor